LLQITCDAFSTFSTTARGRGLGREFPLRSGLLIPRKMINIEVMNIVAVRKVLFTASPCKLSNSGSRISNLRIKYVLRFIEYNGFLFSMQVIFYPP
jgi:hypothetical protein